MLDFDRRPPEEALGNLPIFPLPNVVLLPGLVLALNVFESRYVSLVQAVMDGDRYLGIPLLRDPARHLEAQAPIEEVFGIGQIVDHHCLADGRRLIRVEGVGRVRLRDERPRTEAFRRVHAQLLDEPRIRDTERFEVLRAVVERLACCLSDDDRAMVKAWLNVDDRRIALYGLGAVIPSLRLLQDIERGARNPRCPPELELQQRCMTYLDPDERVELLLEAAQEILEINKMHAAIRGALN